MYFNISRTHLEKVGWKALSSTAAAVKDEPGASWRNLILHFFLSLNLLWMMTLTKLYQVHLLPHTSWKDRKKQGEDMAMVGCKERRVARKGTFACRLLNGEGRYTGWTEKDVLGAVELNPVWNGLSPFCFAFCSSNLLRPLRLISFFPCSSCFFYFFKVKGTHRPPSFQPGPEPQCSWGSFLSHSGLVSSY